ncbi:hypothetical protein [Gymnodinialimonas hymeniacidonis]|uniref:hypothetical protein n=1 Tax=Gymnodinialimonas hymeniacidonis TaxID=3126508 RepID=UPI0034C65A94
MTLKSFGISAVLLVAAAASASAQVANGRYQIGACTTHPEEQIVRLENNVLYGYESVCTLSNPVPVDGTDGYSYVANCEGEGHTWQSNLFLIPLQDGQVLRLIRDGNVLDYNRCTP